MRFRQADERQVMLRKITGEGGSILRTDYQDAGLALFKFCNILAQLRHVCAAERSHEAAIKDQPYVAAPQIRESDRIPV